MGYWTGRDHDGAVVVLMRVGNVEEGAAVDWFDKFDESFSIYLDLCCEILEECEKRFIIWWGMLIEKKI